MTSPVVLDRDPGKLDGGARAVEVGDQWMVIPVLPPDADPFGDPDKHGLPGSLTADGWDPEAHPRGPDGRFGEGEGKSDEPKLTEREQNIDGYFRAATDGKIGYTDMMSMLSKGLPEGTTVTLQTPRWGRDGLEISGYYKTKVNEAGSTKMTGEFERVLSPATIGREGWLRCDALSIDSRLQGQGIARSHYEAMATLAQAAGATQITLTANVSVGGYAWAKFGFVPDDRAEFGRMIGYRAEGAEQKAAAARYDSADPHSVYALADSSGGKGLLLGSEWDGRLDMTDPVAMGRFNDYIHADLPVMEHVGRQAVAASGGGISATPTKSDGRKAEPVDENGDDAWIWAEAGITTHQVRNARGTAAIALARDALARRRALYESAALPDLSTFEYDPEKHPKGPDGKFEPTGGPDKAAKDGVKTVDLSGHNGMWTTAPEIQALKPGEVVWLHGATVPFLEERGARGGQYDYHVGPAVATRDPSGVLIMREVPDRAMETAQRDPKAYIEFQSETVMAIHGAIADAVGGMDVANRIQGAYSLLRDASPTNAYWAEKFGVEKFNTSATGGRGQLTSYNDILPGVSTATHEAGHNLDSASGYVSDSRVYTKATETDNAVGMTLLREHGGSVEAAPPDQALGRLPATLSGGVTQYGANSRHEDFAESFRLWAAEQRGQNHMGLTFADGYKPNFSEVFPGRAQIIDNNVGIQQGLADTAARR